MENKFKVSQNIHRSMNSDCLEFLMDAKIILRLNAYSISIILKNQQMKTVFYFIVFNCF